MQNPWKIVIDGSNVSKSYVEYEGKKLGHITDISLKVSAKELPVLATIEIISPTVIAQLEKDQVLIISADSLKD